MIITIEELSEAIKNNTDELWFVNYFELDIEILVERFQDLIKERQKDLPYELGLTERPITYED